MVAIDDVLNESLGACIYDWFEPPFTHPFVGLQTISVPESVRPLPKRWVDEVIIELHIDDQFAADGGDPFAETKASTWNPEEGRHRLRSALVRLDLSEDHVAHPNIGRMSRHEFASEKRRVKQELKRYDAEFRKQFGRLPAHSEKEPMRPLYVYYRRLKTMIAQAEQGGRGGGHGHRESLAAIPDVDETTPQHRGEGGGGRGGGSVEVQIAALEARIETLQGEKSAVRQKLQAFQERFVTENQRKIQFHKDILPIEREYRMYKNLKEEIQKVEVQLRDLQDEA